MDKLYYLEYLIDLAVVITGVTVAFLLSSYWEKVKRLGSEKKYLNSFLSDLRHDSNLAQELCELNRKKLERAKAFKESIKDNSQSPETSIEVFQDITTINQFTPKMSAYVSIVNSGSLNIIRSYDLREKLASYYISFEEIKLIEKISNDFTFNTAIPFIYQNIDLLKNELIVPDSIQSTEFKNLFIGYYALLQQVFSAYEGLKRDSERIVEMIEKAI